MKKPLSILTMCFALFMLPGEIQAQNVEKEIKYMNDLFLAIENSKSETWAYLKAVTRGKGARKVENKRIELISEINSARNAVKRVRKITPDDSLKHAVENYVSLSYTVLREDYGKILDMEEIAEQSYDLMEAYLLAKEKASDKLNAAYDEMISAQETFAASYGINLVEGEADKISKRIRNADELLKYYNDVYLIFFKAYKQELYVLDAMMRNDLIGFEQNTGTLLSYAEEGLEIADTLQAFRDDPSLKLQLQEILKFYKEEAEVDFPLMTDFYVKKDNFEKISKNFESIKAKDRTQQDVDRYNEAIDIYNQAARESNENSEATNRKRNQALKEWNKAVESFFDEHSD